jgi:RNA polymerase sigma-70 factor, ECF subfamily
LSVLSEREAHLKALFLRSQAGDTAAYATCLSELSLLLRGFMRKRLASIPDEVEDLVQEVLLAIHNQRHTFDASQPLTAWAHGIARFKLVDFFRRRGGQGQHVDIDDVEADLSFESQPAEDAKRDVLTLLDDLPEKQREAIHWVKIEGLSIAEAANKTGQSQSSIKVGIHRGLKALADRMRGVA